MNKHVDIAICDDNGAFVDIIEMLVKNVMFKMNVDYNLSLFYSGKEIISGSRNNSFDVILLDIDMPQKTGFEVADEIYQKQPNTNVIFVTSHEELAYQAYDYHPYQFVHKSDLDKLPRVLETLYNKIVSRSQYDGVVHLKLGGIIDVNVNEVLYIKSEKNYILIMNTNKTMFKYRGKIKNVYAQLIEYGFIHPHRSYVVNCRYISDFDRKEITMKNGEIISVSRDDEVRKEAQHLYGKHMRSTRW